MKLIDEDILCYLFIDNINKEFPGFTKIINNLEKVIVKTKIIYSISQVNDFNRTIPIGIVASYQFIKKFNSGRVAFIIDAPTLGFLSVSKFYIKQGQIFNLQLIGAILRYIKYYFIEKKVLSKYKKIIVVSEHDATYLRNKYKKASVLVIPNGVDLPDLSKKQTKSFSYTLGILSYWGAGGYKDVEWFIQDYLPKLRKVFPEIKLIAAGRGADQGVVELFRENGIQFQGEVKDLWDFFNQIDIYITTLRKECGILNKVLDAMAHQKIVVGLKHNMHAFKGLKDGFLTYNNLNDLIQILDFVRKNPKIIKNIEENAYNYVLLNHDWKKNYKQLYDVINQNKSN